MMSYIPPYIAVLAPFAINRSKLSLHQQLREADLIYLSKVNQKQIISEN